MNTLLAVGIYFLGLVVGFILGRHMNEDTKRINHSIRQGFLAIYNKLDSLKEKS